MSTDKKQSQSDVLQSLEKDMEDICNILMNDNKLMKKSISGLSKSLARKQITISALQ